jgi:NAD(P)-dependent dehydrogenase (short-subunit alcohol dehydrogenase family)
VRGVIGNLSGRVAIVFGAGSGADGMSNGQAAAMTYARAGARVVAVDLSRTPWSARSKPSPMRAATPSR